MALACLALARLAPARPVLLAAALAVPFGATAVRADCPALLDELRGAIAAKSLDAAKSAEKRIYLDDVCSAQDEQVKEQVVALEADLAADPQAGAATRAAALDDLRNPAGWLHSWATAAGVADRLFKGCRFGEAMELYDRAIALAGDPSAMSDGEKRDVLGKASAAKMLASDDDGGRRPARFAGATRGPGGALEGIYSPSLRSVVAKPIPLPINFATNSTEFTPVGEKAAAELGDYLKQQQVAGVTLIGHTDPRGADAYNVKLSEARVRRVAEFLQQRGVSAKVSVVGKGWHDPFDTSVLPYEPTQEEVWALDRRVELVREGRPR